MNEHRSHTWIRDIKADDPVRGLYLVRSKRVGTTKKGTPFMSLTLADRTGDMEARVWEGVDGLSPLFHEGDVIEVEGYAGAYRNEVQATLSSLRMPDGGVDPGLFVESTPGDVPEMMRSLREILKQVEEVHLRALVDRFLSDRRFVTLFREAPAAKNFHHAYLGGLLEHTLSVCRLAQAVTLHYPDLDRDLLLAGAFLHDIGKVREFRFDRLIDYTPEGRLLGHLMLGVAMVEEKAAGLRGFPEDLLLRLKHLILSHHGEHEFGSPKRPKFLEAFALHLIDDLDAKMNGLKRFMDRDRQEGVWTEFNRLFDRYFLKGRLSEDKDGETEGPTDGDRQKPLFSF